MAVARSVLRTLRHGLEVGETVIYLVFRMLYRQSKLETMVSSRAAVMMGMNLTFYYRGLRLLHYPFFMNFTLVLSIDEKEEVQDTGSLSAPTLAVQQ